jgi:hypothetical protein
MAESEGLAGISTSQMKRTIGFDIRFRARD